MPYNTAGYYVMCPKCGDLMSIHEHRVWYICQNCRKEKAEGKEKPSK
jgi:ribosomal protein S27AE